MVLAAFTSQLGIRRGDESARDGLDSFTDYSYGTYYLIGTKQILFTGVAIGDTIGGSHRLARGIEMKDRKITESS
jgi:hypothetical protein